MKKMMMTAWVLVLAVALAACSSGGGTSNTGGGNAENGNAGTVNDAGTDNSAAPADDKPKEKKKVTFATITGYYSTALKEAAADYTKLHPETEVEINIIADNTAYKTNFDAKMAAGGDDAPDIVHINLVGDKTENVKKGYLSVLNDFVNEPNPYNGGTPVKEGIDQAYDQYAVDNAGNIVNLNFDLVGTGFFYNKDIFNKVGIQEPKTWEDLFAASEKLKAAGYIPLAMPWQYEGWMWDAFTDWASHTLYPELLILPGDGRYDEAVHKRNTEIAAADVSDPGFDVGAIFDPEKTILAWKNKKYDNQGPVEVKEWNTLKELSKYYQPGYATMDDASVYQLFLSQKAAMFWNGSWQVGTLLGDQKKLGDKAFAWGTFKFPGFASPDPNFPGDPRGILVPGHLLGLTQKKDEEQMNRSKDFLKYLFSKDVAQKVFERTLEVGEFVQGPSLVKGVTLPEDVNSYLTGFKVAGNMQYTLAGASRGVMDTDKTTFDALVLKFYGGKIPVEEFLAEKAKLVQRGQDKSIKDNKYDLDPATNP